MMALLGALLVAGGTAWLVSWPPIQSVDSHI